MPKKDGFFFKLAQGIWDSICSMKGSTVVAILFVIALAFLVYFFVYPAAIGTVQPGVSSSSSPRQQQDQPS